jgi:membrane-associated phospholipid phosphatase
VKEVVYDWGGFNLWLFHAINNVRGELLDRLMLLGTTLGDHNQFALYITLLAIACWWWAARAVQRAPAEFESRALAGFAVLATFSLAYFAEGFLVAWLKQSFDYPRPPLALLPGSFNLVGRLELHHSLPSGHATFAMTVGASPWPLFGRTGRLLLAAFVLWVGLSRVSLGVHFPADVLAGYLLGLLVVLSIRLLLTRMLPSVPAQR